jgi:hypothetical protein
MDVRVFAPLFFLAFSLAPALADENPNVLEDGNYALTIHECLASMGRSLTKNVVGGVYFSKACDKKPDSSRYVWAFQYKKKTYESGWLGPKTEDECAAALGSELNKEIAGLEITILNRCQLKQPIHPGLSAYTWNYRYTPVQ